MRFKNFSFILLPLLLLTQFEVTISIEANIYGNKKFNEWTWLTSHNSHVFILFCYLFIKNKLFYF